MSWIKRRLGKTETRNIIAIFTVVGSFALLAIMQVWPIPAVNEKMIYLTVGFVFGGSMTRVYEHYFPNNRETLPSDKIKGDEQ